MNRARAATGVWWLAYGDLAWAEAPAWMPVAACAAVTTGARLLTLWLGWKLPAVKAP